MRLRGAAALACAALSCAPAAPPADSTEVSILPASAAPTLGGTAKPWEGRPDGDREKVSPGPPPRLGPNAEAEALFTAAREQMRAGNPAQACKLFEQSHAIDPALGTLLNIGSCREQMGDVPGACASYAEAVTLAAQRSDERRRFAEGKMTSLGCP